MKFKSVFWIILFLINGNFVYAQSKSLDKITLLIMQEDYQDAVNELKQIIEREPENTYALYYLGLAYQGLYENKNALTSFEKAVSKDSTNIKYLLALGKSYSSSGNLRSSMQHT